MLYYSMGRKKTEGIEPEKSDELISPPASTGSTLEERLAKNRALFNGAGGEIWRLTVYEPVHDGWLFANIGGRQVLDQIGSVAGLNESSEVIEFCCGLADTCCYLALNFGCRVTGIDINPHQLQHACLNLFNRRSQVCDRVQFVCEDVSSWEPQRRYDLVYAMDSLMYLPDRREILSKAYNSLVPGGRLVIAEVAAGPNISEAARDLMWQKEGVIEILSCAQQMKMITEAGFSNVKQQDLTAQGRDCFEKISAATRRHRKTLIRLEGGALYSERLSDNQMYAQFFRDGTLMYFLTYCER